MQNKRPIECLLWSIALPGFGQLLNGKYVKGLSFIVLEIIINQGSHLNMIILYSFQGEINKAITGTDFQWLMFYPCVYMFSIWDAYKDAGGGRSYFATFPFVFCAFFATVGIMYSSEFTIFNVLWGPVWLPMLFAAIGVGFGFILKTMCRRLEL